jgi:hypothetical protein
VALPAGPGGIELEQFGVSPARSKPDLHRSNEPRLRDDLSPERIVGGRQLWDLVQDIIDQLPQGQRAVLLLRDIEGQTAEEACELLNISAENQRVLLHRARARVRQAVDAATDGPAATSTKPARSARRLSPGDAPIGRPMRTAGLCHSRSTEVAMSHEFARAVRGKSLRADMVPSSHAR